MVFSQQGDPVLLPQGAMLSRTVGDADSDWKVHLLREPERAILLESHPLQFNMRRVYLTSGAWWVDESEIQDLVGVSNAYQAY